MNPEDVYWDKPDLADDLREMGDNLFRGIQHSLRLAMLHSAAKRIESQAAEIDRLRSIIGDKVWCHACGSVTTLDEPDCDCTRNEMPDRQRLRAYDADAHAKIAELRAEMTNGN